MTGADLAREVSTPAAYTVSPPDGTQVRYQVAAVDLGIKTATPLAMARRGCQVTVLPAASTAEDILALRSGRSFLLQRPGRPGRGRLRGGRGAGRAGRRRAGVRHLPGQPGAGPGARPGHLQAPLRPPRGEPAGQGPGHRAGADHQPQSRLRGRHARRRRRPARPARRRVGPASTPPGPGQHGAGGLPGQHGAAPGATFPTDFGPAQITHVNLNDGVVEGLRLLEAPAFSVQYHPEAAPGPHDAAGLFEKFCDLMDGAGGGGHAQA